MSRLFNHQGLKIKFKLICFISFWAFPCLLFSQNTGDILNQQVSIKFKKESCADALNILKKELDVKFTYNNSLLPIQKFSKRFRKETLENILLFLLQGTDLEIVAENERIILKARTPAKKEIIPVVQKRKFTLNGYLKDGLTGEELVGGTISILPIGGGAFTNEYGFFSLTFLEGDYIFQFDYIGYESEEIKVNLDRNQQISIELSPLENELTEVIVTDSKFFNQNPTKASQDIDVGQLNNFLALFGEPDVFRNLKLMPGVQDGGTADGGLSIRGGRSDHNLILLDEAPIYHPSHTLGLFSIFNPDVVKNIKLIKGRIPTEFRGRLSSIIDVRMDEGNNKKFGMAGGIGLLAARLKIEGKVSNGEGSYMIAGRRTFPDLILKAFSEDFNGSDGVFFHDLNFKFNRKIGKKDRIFVSAYSGRDVFRFGENFQTVWGNNTLTLRWNHLYNEKLFSNTSIIINDFTFKSSTDLGGLVNNDTTENLLIETQVGDIHLKSIFNYYVNPQLELKFGGNYTHHSFVPNKIFNENEQRVISRTSSRKAIETSFFMESKWQPNKDWTYHFGLHNSGLFVLGDDDWIYDYDDFGNLTDSTYYSKLKLVKPYFGIEPRISAMRNLSNNAELSFAYSHTIQYLQLLTSSFVNNPASVWLPSSNNIKPQKAHQINVGYHQNLLKQNLKFSIEGYFIYRNNQIAFRDGADYAPEIDLESQLTFGQSWTSGMELFLKKPKGRLRGWISYTFSSSYDKYAQINDGKIFSSINDRPHNVAVVAIFDAKPHLRMSVSWTYVSGKLLTVPAGKYELNGQIINYYGARNNYRLSDNKRLDISLLWHRVSKKGVKHNWSFSIYNAMVNQNPQFLYVDEVTGEATEITLLGIIPSFSYSFEF